MMETTHPEPGTLVYDPVACKVGEYRDRAGPYVMLRPVGGGREWQADPGRLRPATADERLAAALKAANARSGQAAATVRHGEDLTRPPAPVPDCPTCTELAVQRDDARARRDGTEETDANVLLRRHLRAEHGTPTG